MAQIGMGKVSSLTHVFIYHKIHCDVFHDSFMVSYVVCLFS